VRRLRRLPPAARIVLGVACALLFAALLDAHGLRKTAEIQPQGVQRDVAIVVTKRLVSVSHFLYLDRPRQELKAAIGRGDDDRIDTKVVLSASPAVPKPSALPHPRPAPRAEPAPRPGAEPAPRPSRPQAGPASPARPHAGPATPARPRPTPPLAARPAFSPARPLRLWVAGDSLAAVPGQSLERATAGRSAIDVLGVESRVSTGLGRPDVFNWFSRILSALRELRPRVAVLSFGADDAHDYMSGVPAGRSIGPLGSRSWVAEYRRRVDGVTRELNDAGVYVVWLGLPIARGEGWNRGFRVVNSILAGVAGRHPRGAYYLDTWRMFAVGGRYAQYLRNSDGRLVQMRAGDGVHYEPAAGDAIARAVLHQLSRVFDLTSWRPRAGA